MYICVYVCMDTVGWVGGPGRPGGRLSVRPQLRGLSKLVIPSGLSDISENRDRRNWYLSSDPFQKDQVKLLANSANVQTHLVKRKVNF